MARLLPVLVLILMVFPTLMEGQQRGGDQEHSTTNMPCMPGMPMP
jgi:hypothetical protein